MKKSSSTLKSANATATNQERAMWLRMAATMACAMAIGAVVGNVSVRLESVPKASHQMSSIAIFGGAIAALFIAIAAHELGHFLAGVVVGFRCLLFQVWPFALVRNSRDRFEVQLRASAKVLGLCSMIPQNEDRLLQRFSWFAIGGPIGSLIFGALALAIHFLLTRGASIDVIVVFFALISIALGVLSLLPIPTQNFMTDGARWLQLRAGGIAAERDLALLRLVTFQMSGVDPKEWPETVFQTLGDLRDHSVFEAMLYFSHYYHASALGRFDEAANDLERASEILKSKGNYFKDSVIAERFWFELWRRGNELPIDPKSLSRQSVSEPLRVRCEIVKAIRAEDDEWVRRLFARAWLMSPDLPQNRWERACLMEMQKVFDNDSPKSKPLRESILT